jgi:hypothetical protein
MGLAQSINKALHSQLELYVAWVPVINTFKVGEYGIFKDSIFTSQGHLKDKYPDINLKTEKGNPAEFDFLSAGTKIFKFDASGKAIDSFAGLGNAEATLKFVFQSADSCKVTAKMTSEELKNIDEVGTFLAKKDNWRNKFCVVSKAYTGENCVVIGSKEAGTEIEIKASADILKQIEAGKVNGGFEFKSNRDSTFKAIGETGVLALSLFKLNIFNRPKVLPLDAKVDFKVEELKGDMEDDF